MISNYGEQVAGIITHDREVVAEMEAFDQLPALIRRVLDTAALRFGSVEVLAYWRQHRRHFTDAEIALTLLARAAKMALHAHRETYGGSDMAPIGEAAA